MTADAGRTRLTRGTAFRVALFLSLALIPVGLIAVVQTREVAEQGRARAISALASAVEMAARQERMAIQNAFGAARGIGATVLRTADDPETCIADMQRLVAAVPEIVTAGFTGPDGVLRCVSTGETHDFSQSPVWKAILADPKPVVTLNRTAPVSRTPVVVVSQPVFDGGDFAGAVFVSLPHGRLAARSEDSSMLEIDLMTFNASGEILTGGAEEDGAPSLLPANRQLTDFVQGDTVAFRDETVAGATRLYAVVPIVPGTVYAMGSWDGKGRTLGYNPVSAPVFPLLMWLISLAVAFAAVHRLVIRHIRELQRAMRAFARNRQIPGDGFTRDMPVELAEITDTFIATARTVVWDEAALEQNLRDKDVLLKEVHHRVKNNLQLISSIMNMQVRQMKSPEGRRVVKRLQDRVLGLATIHRNLYQTENVSEVAIDVLLDDLIRQLAAVATGPGGRVAIRSDFEHVSLFPDQALPLSLLVTEATTNALKYLGTQGDAQPWIEASLRKGPDGGLTFSIANSLGPTADVPDTGDGSGTGLGSGLIRAFASQLEASLTVRETDDSHIVICRFAPKGFDPDPVDTSLAEMAPA